MVLVDGRDRGGRKERDTCTTHDFQIQAPPKEGDAKLNAELEQDRKSAISANFEKSFNSDFNSHSNFREN